jgi:FMN-dependent oxidoreductase (nitrilotriacetate monooxygenase family)
MGDLILNAAILGLGMHLGAWRHDSADPFACTDVGYYREIARLAEKGLLHAVFLADTLAVAEENFERPNLGAMDPIVVLAALAETTTHVGLVATASTTYNEPYNLARRLSSLDHLSRGRAGWNIVTTFVPDVAANFGTVSLPRGDARYDRAEEFVDVVRDLWASWEPGSLVGDKQRGVFADSRFVHAIDHHGAHFDVRGPLTLPRSPQGWPVLFQAGSSEPGRNLAARTADVIFTARNTLESARSFRDDIRIRAREFGRDPRSIRVLPGLAPVIGGTEAQARRRKDDLDRLAGNAELRKLALRVGVRADQLDLDAPLPVDLIEANDSFRGSEGFRSAAVNLATAGRLTVRELLYRNGGGHLQVVGTPEQVADTIANWHQAGAADGFNLMIDVLPDGFDAFVAEVVPLLQKRGAFRTEPSGSTLRANLGIEVQ